jgi:hypothetical protein
MKLFSTVLAVSFVLVGSANAGNIATFGTATCGASTPCQLGPYAPGNAIDGDLSTIWVAPGVMTDPYLLIDLNQTALVDSITIYGFGNLGRDLQFELFAGTTSNVATLEGGTALGGEVLEAGTGQYPNPAGNWSFTYNFSSPTAISAVLVDFTCAFGSTSNVGGCPSSLDDAYVSEVNVDAVPEPATFGLIGIGLLALGFQRHRLQQQK